MTFIICKFLIFSFGNFLDIGFNKLLDEVNGIFISNSSVEVYNPVVLSTTEVISNSRSYKRYTDFWKEKFILDAKYKNFTEPIDRNDINQIISYMYVKQADIGGFIYPSKNSNLECIDIHHW